MTPVTAANSLAAIKHCVFDRKEVTPADLKAALAVNFEGWDALRKKLLAAPKWGNDDDRVDLLGKDLLEFSSREILKHRTISGDPFMPGIHQPHTFAVGEGLSATPDGRPQGEPVPVTLSPANGTDRNGPTAAMCSAAKIDPKMTPWNFALSLNFDPATVSGPEGIERFTHLFRAFFAMGGMELQGNVVSIDTLRDAQVHPDQYPGLVVRVWGFSGRFVELAKGYQDDLIARTSHAV
jgi:formate C-acetyltransferase